VVVSLRLRLVAVLAVLVIVLSVAAVTVRTAMERVRDSRDLVSEKLEPAAVRSRALLVSLVDQETGQRGFVITGDDQFLAPYRNGQQRFIEHASALRAVFGDDRIMREALDRLAVATEQWRRVGAQPEIAARRAGDLARAEDLVRAGAGRTAFDLARAEAERLQDLIDARTRQARAQDQRDLEMLRWLILGSVGLTLLALAVVALLLRRWVLLPVLRTRASMREVARGELGRHVSVEGPPEVAAIGRDAESMRRRIVSELAAAQAATEALGQHSPAVAGLRRELGSVGGEVAPGIDLRGEVLPAEGVLTGDWWEARRRPDGTTAVVVADVSGHGTEAGLVALRFKQRIGALLDSTLDVETLFAIAAELGEEDPERFVACLLLVIDPVAGRLTWINAGHPPGLLVHRGRPPSARELGPTGPLVSAVSTGWTARTALLGPTDLLLLCTDGILEARDSDGREFGTSGVLGVLARLRQWSVEEAVAECIEAVRRHAVDLRRDDLTCVAVAVKDREVARV
jgi:sigma-B regulation protein RsbU (phosphoserine phosphatase)